MISYSPLSQSPPCLQLYPLRQTRLTDKTRQTGASFSLFFFAPYMYCASPSLFHIKTETEQDTHRAGKRRRRGNMCPPTKEGRRRKKIPEGAGIRYTSQRTPLTFLLLLVFFSFLCFSSVSPLQTHKNPGKPSQKAKQPPSLPLLPLSKDERERPPSSSFLLSQPLRAWLAFFLLFSLASPLLHTRGAGRRQTGQKYRTVSAAAAAASSAKTPMQHGEKVKTDRQSRETKFHHAANKKKSTTLWKSLLYAIDGRILFLPRNRQRSQSHTHTQPSHIGGRGGGENDEGDR